MTDIGHCQECNHKFYLQGSDLHNIVQGGGCPSCGGHQVYRAQVSPVHGEMELRNMIDPGTNDDMGGNPLQEGILGTTDGGWGNRMKRDESFASVKHAGPRLHKKEDNWSFSSLKEANPPIMLYEHSDVPEDQSILDYHREQHRARCLNCDNPFFTRPGAPPFCATCLLHHPELVAPQYTASVKEALGAPDSLQHAQVFPESVYGIHNGPAYALASEGVLINGKPVDENTIYEHGAYNPNWNPAQVQPITLSHSDPTVLEAAKNIVQNGGGMETFHPLIYNAHQEEVQPHPNGFSHDVIRGLASLDTYINNARMRSLAMGNKGPDGQFHLDHDGSPVVLGARNPEQLAVAKRVLQEGSSNPAREYGLKQQQVQAKASALAVNKRHMDTLGQTIYMPWTVESTTKEAWLGPLGDAVDAAGGVVNDATAPIGSAIDTATGALPQPIQDVGHFVGKHAIPIGAGLGVLAGGALIASGIGAPAGAALEGVAAPALVGGEAAAAGADAAGAIGAGAAADAGATAGGLGSEMALADSGIAASRGSAVANTLKGALSDPKGLATNAARGAIKKIRANALGGAAGYGGGQAAGGGGSSNPGLLKSLMPGSTSDGGAGIGNYNIDKGYWGFQGSTKEADYETPTSMPSVPGLGNDTYEDPREFADGASTNNLNDPTINGIGGTDSIHPAIRLFHEHLPLLLHYYDSEESGRDDPNVLKVHRALDAAHPGYLAYAGHGGIDIRPHEHHHAALPGEKCPKCGMPLPAQGPCLKCGYNPQQAVAPATGMGTLPTTGPMGNTPIMPTSALDQGPQTDEQKAAVAEVLEREGRAKEIPLMLEKGYLYAKELAQVQHKFNQPPPNVPADQQVQAPPPPQPGGNMPMPGMQTPQPALSSIIKRFAVDNVAPKCPKCKSHTTGVLSEDGQCRCHNCGNTWKEKLEATKIGADSLAPRCPKCKSHTTGVIDEKGQCRCHSCGNTWDGKLEATKVGAPIHHEERPNVINAPAAEQQGQRDVSREQDSAHMWATADGEPLRVGSTYQMHSGKYNIPDIIRIESVKPDSIDFVIQSQYGLDPRDSITREEAQLEKLTFTSYNEDQKDGEDLQDTAQPPDSNNQQGASPGQVSDLSTPHYRSNITTATNTVAGTFGPQVGEPPTSPKPESPPEPPPEKPKEEPVKEKAPKKSSVVCSSCQSDDITSELHSPEVRHFDCFRCGHAWNEYEDDGLDKVSNILPEESRAWIQADESGPIPHVPVDRSGQSRNGAAGLRTAGAKFSPSEQREFIDERGKARNSDRLDLEDTHYKARFHEGNGDLVNDDHLALGI